MANRPLVIILALGLFVRVVLLASTSMLDLRIVDEQHYAELASSLASGQGFAWSDGRLTSMRPPLYPFLISSLWRLSGTHSLVLVRAAQVGISLLTVVLIYVLGLKLFDRRTATIAAAIFCFYPSFLFSGVLLLTEVLVTFWLVLLAVEYFELMRRPRVMLAAAVGATVGLAALTRSALWPFPILLAPLTFFAMGGPWRQRAQIVMVLLAGYAVVVGPWAVRNTRLQRTVTIVDTMGGLNLRMGNYEYTPSERMWDAIAMRGAQSWSHDLIARTPEAAWWTEGQKEKWAQGQAIAYILQHPLVSARRSALKFADFWGLERELPAGILLGSYRPSAWLAMGMIAAVFIAYPVVALGAAVGVFRAARSDARTHLLLLSLAALIAGIHTIVFGHSRYHLPLVPFLAIYAAAAFTQQCWKDMFKSPRFALGPALAIAVLTAIWVHELAGRDLERARALVRLLT